MIPFPAEIPEISCLVCLSCRMWRVARHISCLFSPPPLLPYPARYDLDPTDAWCGGAIDAKITSHALRAANLSTSAISGIYKFACNTMQLLQKHDYSTPPLRTNARWHREPPFLFVAACSPWLQKSAAWGAADKIWIWLDSRNAAGNVKMAWHHDAVSGYVASSLKMYRFLNLDGPIKIMPDK